MTPPPRKPTPQPGVPEDDEDWENSDVHASPPSPSPARTAGARPPTAGGAYSQQRPDDGGRATARKALAKIDELGKRFDEHRAAISKSFEEHAREDRDQFRSIDEKLDGQNEVLAKLRENTATNTATSTGVQSELAGLRSELRLAREVEVRKQLKQHEAKLEDENDTKAHERKVKFEWGKILPAVVIAIASALITAIATGKLRI